MGKGKDGCDDSSAVGMGSPGMLDGVFAEQQRLITDPGIKATSITSSAKISSDKAWYVDIETWEKDWALATVEGADQLRSEGAAEDKVVKYFESRDKQRDKERKKRLRLSLEESVQEQRTITLSPIGKVIASTAACEMYDDAYSIPGRELLAKFENSDEFIENLKKVLGNKTDHLGKTVSEKHMENAKREAALLTIGIYDSDETTGYWKSPDGTEYIMEVVRSARDTDLMDLVILAVPVNGDSSQINTLQIKSYKTTSRVGADTEAGKERGNRTGSLKIPKVFKLEGQDRYSLEKASKEVRMRMSATSVYEDISVHEQLDENREAEAATSVSSVTDPEVHKAISRAKDLHSIFRPTKKANGKYGFLEARIECINSRGEPCVIKIQTKMSAQLGSDGEPIIDKSGVCKVDREESAGKNTGEIEIDISISGWHRVNKLSILSRSKAKAIINTPGKLEEYGIES